MNLTPWLINQFRNAVTQLEVQIKNNPRSIYRYRISHPAYGSEMMCLLVVNKDCLELLFFENANDFYFYVPQQEGLYHRPFQKLLHVIRNPLNLEEVDEEVIITHDGKVYWNVMEILENEVHIQVSRSRLKEAIHLIQCLTKAMPLTTNKEVGANDILEFTMDEEDQIISAQLKENQFVVTEVSLSLDEAGLKNYRNYKKSEEILQVDAVGIPDYSATVSPYRVIFKNQVLICSSRHQYHNPFTHCCNEDVVDHLAADLRQYFELYGIPRRIEVNHPWTEFVLEPFCTRLNIELVVLDELELCEQLSEDLFVEIEQGCSAEELSSLN